MTAYVALLRKQPDSDYGVDFPDFPGCVTAGTTLEDARRMAAEAIRLHVEGMIEDREPIPAPSRLGEIMADPNHRDAVTVLIDAAVRRLSATKAEREKTGDTRLSLEERYPTKDAYVTAVRKAAQSLVARRLLLPEDANA